jgi:hypothetical protein
MFRPSKGHHQAKIPVYSFYVLNKFVSLMTAFQRSKHFAFDVVHLVVLNVCLLNNNNNNNNNNIITQLDV